MNKRFASIGLTAGLVAGGVAGIALGVNGVSSASQAPAVSAAATDDSSAATTDDTTADAPAGSINGAGDGEGRPDPSARLQDVLQPLVDDGTLTQDQATAVIDAITAARPEGGHGPGMGHGGRGGHGAGARGLGSAAEALGVTAEELRTALQGGQTIADVAAEKGVDVQTVIDAMLADVQAHFAEEVAAGEHTQEEVDAKLAEITTRITEFVNNGRPAN